MSADIETNTGAARYGPADGQARECRGVCPDRRAEIHAAFQPASGPQESPLLLCVAGPSEHGHREVCDIAGQHFRCMGDNITLLRSDNIGRIKPDAERRDDFRCSRRLINFAFGPFMPPGMPRISGRSHPALRPGRPVQRNRAA